MSDPGMGPADDLSGTVIACAIVSLVVSGIALGLRFYSRGVITRVLGREDWCILIAWILAIGYTVAVILECKAAIGRHVWQLEEDSMPKYLKASYVNVIFYQLSLAFSKISILFLYIRVLTYDYARRAAYVVLAIVIIYNTLGFISTMTLCRPLRAFWDDTVEGKCHPVSFMWAAIGLHIATDFLIFLIPMPVISKMTLPLAQKLGLLLVFALGFLVCVISILRAVWIKALVDSQDLTYDYTAINNWTSIEVNLPILIPCLIVIKPLINKFWPSTFLSHRRTRENRVYNLGEIPLSVGSKPSRSNRQSDKGEDGEYQTLPSAKSSFLTEHRGLEETRRTNETLV